MQEKDNDCFAINEVEQSGINSALPILLPDLLRHLNLDQAGENTNSIENTMARGANLVAALQHSKWYVRAQAVYQLGELGEEAPPELLLHALDDPDPAVRGAAVDVAGKMDRRVPLARIVAALRDSDWQVREIAAQTLSIVHGVYGEQAQNALKETLHDSDAMVRRAATHTLTLLRSGQSVDHERGLTSLWLGRHEKRWHPARLRRRWLAVVAAASFISVLLMPNTLVLADHILAGFRVMYFQVIRDNSKIDSTHAFPGLQDLGDLQVKGFQAQQNLSAGQAARLVNFPLRLPASLPQGMQTTPLCTVTGSGQTTFTFRTKIAQAYLARNGYTGVSIPLQLDGAVFTIHVAANVVLNYHDSIHLLQVTETPTPVITAVSGTSINILRDFLLSLPTTMPVQVVKQMAQIDLNSGTIPVVVAAQTNVQHVYINGAEGIFLSGSTNSSTPGQLIWQTSGIIYTIQSQEGGSEQSLSIAKSMH